MKIKYILTTFSPAMFGERATAHIKVITADEAVALVESDTAVVATRVSHERLAKNLFPQVSSETKRYAELRPDTNAILIHYYGPNVSDSGELPAGGVVRYYLIETEEYAEA